MANKSKKGDWKDNFLHISSDSIAKYADEGGEVRVEQMGDDIHIVYIGIAADDSRLSDAFLELFAMDVDA